MININLAQTLFLGIGSCWVVLSLISCVIPKITRFGILSLFIANLFLWISIMYPKGVSNVLLSHGYTNEELSQDFLIRGIIFGVILFALWYLIRVLFFKYVSSLIRLKKKVESAKEEQKGKSVDSKTHEENSASDKYVDPVIFSAIHKNKSNS